MLELLFHGGQASSLALGAPQSQVGPGLSSTVRLGSLASYRPLAVHGVGITP
jgi:hypothetical protein